MWKASAVFLLTVLMAVRFACAQQPPDAVRPEVISSFALLKVSDGHADRYKIPSSDKLLLLIFLSPECPLSKNYTLPLNRLFEQYHQQVSFYGCVSGTGYGPDEISAFDRTYKVAYPLLLDKNKKLTNYITATVTPEVFLVGKNGKMIYSGAIDDWVVALGQQKAQASKHYLEDAIVASLHNQPAPSKRITPYGCRINDF